MHFCIGSAESPFVALAVAECVVPQAIELFSNSSSSGIWRELPRFVEHDGVRFDFRLVRPRLVLPRRVRLVRGLPSWITRSLSASSGTANHCRSKWLVAQEGRLGRQVGRAQHHDRPRLLAEQERNLHHADRQAGIEQQRQDDDHEQRPPVANLVANLAVKDQADVSSSSWGGRQPFFGPRDQVEEQLLEVRLAETCAAAPPACRRPGSGLYG